MKFRTEYRPVRSSLTLDPTMPIVFIGSCFASNMAAKMRECMWDAYNGAGTLFNPMSIAKVLDLMIFGDDSLESFKTSLFESEGIVHSWLFDSHFSGLSKEECLATIGESRSRLLDALDKAQAMIVTFGTSWCYALSDNTIVGGNKQENGEYIVANCHKMPASMFSRRRVSVEEISRLWIDLCNRLKKKYPELTLIFTVSPVRHLKDGFEGNTLSKATLHLAIESICEHTKDCLYFPAYELVCDDLRDYRFYASDMMHPSESAVEYIWEIFCNTFLDSKGEELLRQGNRRFKAANHHPNIKIR